MDCSRPVSRARDVTRFVIPVLAAVLGCVPLMRYQYFVSHELCAPAIRLHELHYVISENLRILVPWSPDLAFGHGYPFFVFYPPLASYSAEIPHLLGADLLQAVKTSFALSLILSGLSMAAFISYINRQYELRACPETIGLAAAVYVIAPYRMVDIYVRGSIAECWSFVFFPLILMGCHMLADDKRYKGLIIGSVSYAALILSHNIMALYFSGILCMYVMAISGIRRRWVWTVALIVLGQGLSAFFWIPALANMSLVKTDPATLWATAEDVASHAVYLPQLLSPFWGFGLSCPGPEDGMPFAVGWPIVAAVALMPLVAADRKETDAARRLALIMLTFLILTTFAMSRLMRWDLVPAIARYIQFPWRMLAFITLFGSVAFFLALHALVRWSDVRLADRRLKAIFFLSVIMIVVMLALPTVRATAIRIGKVDRQYVLDRLEVERNAGVIGTTTRAEYLPKTAAPETYDPEWNEKRFRPAHVELVAGKAEITGWSQRGGEYTVDLVCETEATITFQSYFWPGWRYWRNGTRRDRDMRIDDLGLIQVELPAGTHNLRFEYGSPPWARVSQLVSAATLCALAGWTAAGRYRRESSDG